MKKADLLNSKLSLASAGRVAFSEFSRQTLLSKSEWENCKKQNTQQNSKKRRSPSHRQGPLCHRCSQAIRNWGWPAVHLVQEVQGGQRASCH